MGRLLPDYLASEMTLSRSAILKWCAAVTVLSIVEGPTNVLRGACMKWHWEDLGLQCQPAEGPSGSGGLSRWRRHRDEAHLH